MRGDELMTWLLRAALNGESPITPSLIGSLIGGINVSNPVLLRIENFPVYIQITDADVKPALEPPGTLPSLLPNPRLTFEDPRDGRPVGETAVSVARQSQSDVGDQPHVRLDPAPVRYRLHPHLVFDEQGRGQGETELEIAPWVKVVVVGDVEHVEFTTLGTGRSRQRVYFDRDDPAGLKGVGLNGMTRFGRNRRAQQKGSNVKWSFKRLRLGVATTVGVRLEDGSTNPVLVTVDDAVYDAAWQLTGTDQRKGVFQQHFLLLRERTGARHNV